MNANTKNLTELESDFAQVTTIPQQKVQRFFKTGSGQYAQHDQFLGITVPTLRKIAKNYYHLSFAELEQLLHSPFNEKRLLALFILIHQYQKTKQQAVFDFYLKHIDRVNNWNLVDSSAHLIIGAHLIDQPQNLLIELSASNNLWHRRIAIVATWYFIRKNQLEQTFVIAQKLMTDQQDLIHKAVGWMLREAGKKNQTMLLSFLDQWAPNMPRTMLRYSIEKLSQEQKKSYLTNTRRKTK